MQSVSENQKILSLKHNWKEFYHKYQITVTIWLLFFLSVAIRSLLANGMKVLSTYNDEILYYGLYYYSAPLLVGYHRLDVDHRVDVLLDDCEVQQDVLYHPGCYSSPSIRYFDVSW